MKLIWHLKMDGWETILSFLKLSGRLLLRGKLLVLGMVFFSLVSWNLTSFAVMVHVGHVHHAYGAKEFANAQQAKEDLKSRSASLVGAT